MPITRQGARPRQGCVDRHPGRRRSSFLAVLLAVSCLPMVAGAQNLEDFYSSLVDPTAPVLFAGSLSGVAGTPTEGITDVAAFEGFFDPGEGLANLSADALSQFQNTPLGSTVAGFTYEFDPELNVFVQSSKSLGPTLAERAETTGRFKLNLAASYSHVEFTQFQGTKLDSLNVNLDGTTPTTTGQSNITAGSTANGNDPNLDVSFALNESVELGPGDALRIDVTDGGAGLGTVVGFPGATVGYMFSPTDGQYDIAPIVPAVTLDASFVVDILALYANFGVTDNIDIGVVLPFLFIEMQGRSVTTGVLDRDEFAAGNNVIETAPRVVSAKQSDSGIGDLTLRGKAKFLSTDYVDLATRIDLSLPTGDEKNLRGRGNVAVGLQLIASKTFGRFSPFTNLGFLIDTENDELSNFRYVFGLDFRAHERVTLDAIILGSRDLVSNGIGDNQVNASIGGKFNVWRRLVLGVGCQFRLNDEGLRADYIPSAGVEYTFF